MPQKGSVLAQMHRFSTATLSSKRITMASGAGWDSTIGWLDECGNVECASGAFKPTIGWTTGLHVARR